MYQFLTPSTLLQPYIECYWRVQASAPASIHERIFVDGKADILFNFGCAYERQHLDDGQNDVLGVSNLDGQRRYPVSIAQSGDIRLVGVRFRPGGLAAFLPLSLHEIAGHTIELDTVFGQAARDFEGRLYDASESVEAQRALLDDFFLRRMQVHPQYALVLHIARQIERASEDARLWQISREAGYTFRSMDRLFRRFFGLSPKFYARVTRFQQAMALLTQDRPLADIALACGYYDQAHLNKEFRDFAAQSPQQYRQHLRERLPAPPPPNLVQFFQDEESRLP